MPFKTHNFDGTSIEGGSAISLTVDKDGFIWAGVYGHGIVRYDGKNTEVFNKGFSPVALIHKIWQDKYGYLWFAARSTTKESAGVYVSNRPVGLDLISDSLSFSQNHLGVDLAKNNPFSFDLAMSENGDFLVHERRKLMRYSYESENKFRVDTIINIPDNVDDGVRSTVFLKDGSFVSSGLKGEIIKYNYTDKKGLSVDTTQILEISPNRLFYADSLDGIWGGNGEQLFYINPSKEVDIFNIDGGIDYFLVLDDDRFIFVGNGGLFLVDTKKEVSIRKMGIKEGMNLERLFTLSKSENNIWVCGEGSFVSLPLDFDAFKTYTKESQYGLLENRIKSVYNDLTINGDTILVITTSKGISFVNTRTGETENMNDTNGLTSSNVSYVALDNKKTVWIFPAGSGAINCLYTPNEKPEKVTEIGSINLFGKNFRIGTLRAGIFGPPKLVYFKSENKTKSSSALFGVSYETAEMLLEDQMTVRFDRQNNFHNQGLLYAVCQDKNGYLYAGSSAGVHRSIEPWTYEYFQDIQSRFYLKSKDKKYYLSPDSLFTNIPLVWKNDTLSRINDIIEIEDNLWVATEKGMLIISIENWEIKNLIESDEPFSITKNDNEVWAASTNGLMKFDESQFEFIKVIREEDGFINDICGSEIQSLCSDANNIYFGTFNGLVKYQPSKDIPPKSNPDCVIRNLELSQNEFGDNKVSIDYIALDELKQTEKTYQTRLIGLSDKWSDSTPQTSIDYMNLKAFFFPKTYKFELKVKDHFGEWHPLSTPLSIKIKPPVWFRWWAFFIYGFLIYQLVKWLLKRQVNNIKKSMLLEEAEAIKEKNKIIQQKNDQNELLLKEIHHRVKNNLQTISSLLYLQSASLKDNDAKNALKAVQQRVESMALIHKKLYEENDLSSIEMKAYIKLLLDNLKDAFGYDENSIKSIIKVDDIKLEMDQAIPIGLLITELVTNCLKYAFPNKENAAITVVLMKKDNLINLQVRDNGVGVKENITPSFGTKLITLLTRQLGGKLTSGSDDGYWTNIDFDDIKGEN